MPDERDPLYDILDRAKTKQDPERLSGDADDEVYEDDLVRRVLLDYRGERGHRLFPLEEIVGGYAEYVGEPGEKEFHRVSDPRWAETLLGRARLAFDERDAATPLVVSLA